MKPEELNSIMNSANSEATDKFLQVCSEIRKELHQLGIEEKVIEQQRRMKTQTLLDAASALNVGQYLLIKTRSERLGVHDKLVQICGKEVRYNQILDSLDVCYLYHNCYKNGNPKTGFTGELFHTTVLKNRKTQTEEVDVLTIETK